MKMRGTPVSMNELKIFGTLYNNIVYTHALIFNDRIWPKKLARKLVII